MSRPASVDAIIATVAAEWALTPADILGRSRLPRVVHARQQAFAAVRSAKGSSLPKIGGWFGRDHTTIIHGIRAHEARVAE